MRPLILLHGFTGAPESFDPLLTYMPARSVFRPWLSGHGPAPCLAPSWDAEIERLAALLRGEGIADAHLVGYSLGGRVAFSLLARAPELFARATLIGAHPGLRHPREREARRAHDARWISLLEARGIEGFVDAWEKLPLWSTQRAATRERIRRTRLSHRAEGLAHALRVLGLAAMPPVDPGAIRAPVELVVGALDTRHRAIAERFAPELGATLSLVHGRGHNVPAEAPAALAELLA